MCNRCSQNLKLETFSNFAMLVEYVQVSISQYIIKCTHWFWSLSIGHCLLVYIWNPVHCLFIHLLTQTCRMFATNNKLNQHHPAYYSKLMLCSKYFPFHTFQVTVHVKGKTECYECQPKPVPKSYPVCTITSTPSKVISLAQLFIYLFCWTVYYAAYPLLFFFVLLYACKCKFLIL